MKERKKSDIITFKVDESLQAALENLPNRSSFIRSAVVSALSGKCPLCHGSGVLSMAQRRHWDDFMKSHAIEKCDECSEPHLVCSQESRPNRRRTTGRGKSKR